MLLEVIVGTNGRVEEATVIASSGYPPLDQSALTSIRKAKFHPARSDGKPVRSKKKTAIAYRFEDQDA